MTPCPQIEPWILDFPELPASVRQDLEAHAARCSACHDLLEAAIELDARMSAVAKAPEKLRRRVMARIEERPSSLPEWFDFVGWAAMITVAVGLVRELLATYAY